MEQVSKEAALEMLADGDNIHTFRQGGMMLIGADWHRKDILEAIDKFGVQLSGERATRMNHGLVLKDDNGYLFIETKERLENK